MNSVHGALAGAGSCSKVSLVEVQSINGLVSGCESGNCRLPRLKKRAEFVAVSAGRRIHSSRMTVQIWDRGAGSQSTSSKIHGPRFGLTITKKTASAVGRNRIRRRLRALISQMQPLWPSADTDFVIIGRTEMLTANVDDIIADLKRAFSSPPRQGTPRNRGDRPAHHGRGKGMARSPDTTKTNATE